MGLLLSTYSGDPTSSAPIANAFAEVTEFHLFSTTQHIQFRVGFWRSQADYLAGTLPVNFTVYEIYQTPYQRIQDGLTIPSFAQVLALAVTNSTDAAGTQAFNVVERAIFTFLMTLPEFAGATLVS